MINMEHTTDEKVGVEFQEQLLDYVAYVLTSAKGLYREPQSYGPMRMVDAMERGLRLLAQMGLKDDALEEALAAVRADRWRAGTDTEGFGRAIDASILKLVEMTMDRIKG